MLVVSYADFFANPAQYRDAAARSGIKILPKEKRLSRGARRRLAALHAATGILPADTEEAALTEERAARQ